MGNRLDGQVAWISGATSGIGEATAKLFTAEGARVAVAGIDAEGGARVVTEIRAAGGEARFTPCDVTREADVQASVRQTAERFGGMHIMVNNAGVVHVKKLDAYTEQEWDHLMAVNVRSIFFALKHGLPQLRRNPRSYMVNVGSISSFVGQAATPAYTASKGAVLMLSTSIALDYAADGLRCNCVCPGITDTPMLREHLNKTPDPDGTLARRVRRVPLGRAMRPEDIARAILYLSCEDSAGVTGTSLVVDGGYLAAAEWETP
ncbi:MAG TPA: SDR family oxidoreductase [Gemmataceae bacterium]|jgi:NAD(P)-dependent dehydrogenase (short-subunit alcohol dehydrogenase family)|nr:SDR family oxidoreductase [Gemmataceae bacterium]